MNADWELICNGIDIGGGYKVLWNPQPEDLASLYDRASRSGGLDVTFPDSPPSKVHFIFQAGTAPRVGVYREDPKEGDVLLACLWAHDVLVIRSVMAKSLTASLLVDRGAIPVFRLIRAIRAALFMVWVEHGPCSVVAEVAEGNMAMRAVLRRAGMFCSGSIPMRSLWNGRPCSSILYCWPASR